MQSYQRLSTITMGEHRGNPRIYLQGKWLARAWFSAGSNITAEFGQGNITLRLDQQGERTVSCKRGDIPVIDMNTDQLATALRGAKQLQVKVSTGTIVISASRTEAKRQLRTRNGLEGSIFSGGGLLSQAAKQAGYKPVFAVEWDERYAEIYERNHPESKVLNMSVHDVPLEELPHVELLTMGIPCEPFSTKRRQEKTDAVPEAHPLGDMVFWALRIIDAVNPYTVVVEEAQGFMESGAGWILRHSLVRMGYNVEVRVVDSSHYGGLTRRRRTVVIATTGEIVWPAEEPATRKLGEIFEAGEQEWFDRASKGWLFEHWDKQRAKGNNFDNQKFDENTPCMGAISKRYFSQQGDGPVIRHPEKADTYRWLTLTEVKRLHGLPDDYYLGDAKCTAGEVVGQGVVVSTFTKIIRALSGSVQN